MFEIIFDNLAKSVGQKNRKFNVANIKVQDEINNTIKKEKIHSCMTKKEQEEYWNTFTDLEKDVIGFIDRVIIDRDSTEYTSS